MVEWSNSYRSLAKLLNYSLLDFFDYFNFLNSLTTLTTLLL